MSNLRPEDWNFIFKPGPGKQEFNIIFRRPGDIRNGKWYGNLHVMSQHSGLVTSRANNPKTAFTYVLGSTDKHFINALIVLWLDMNGIDVEYLLQSLSLIELNILRELINSFQVKSLNVDTRIESRIEEKQAQEAKEKAIIKGIIYRLQDLIQILTGYPDWPLIIKSVNTGNSIIYPLFSWSGTELYTPSRFIGKIDYWADLMTLKYQESPRVYTPSYHAFSSRNLVKPDNNMRLVGTVIGYNIGTQRGSNPERRIGYQFVDIKSAYSSTRMSLSINSPSAPVDISDQPYDPTVNYNRRNIMFAMPNEVKEPTVVGFGGIFSREPLTKYIIYPVFKYEYGPIYPDDYLTVSQLTPAEQGLPPRGGRYIKINGISFLSSDLRLLYNTWLYQTPLFTGESELYVPNLLRQDLILLRDLFTGMSPLLHVYEHLSDYAYRLLSGERTMMSIYEELVPRILIDQAYLPGVSLRDQLGTVKVPREIGKIVRLEELLRIASE